MIVYADVSISINISDQLIADEEKSPGIVERHIERYLNIVFSKHPELHNRGVINVSIGQKSEAGLRQVLSFEDRLGLDN